jgi:hypothetical protein
MGDSRFVRVALSPDAGTNSAKSVTYAAIPHPSLHFLTGKQAAHSNGLLDSRFRNQRTEGEAESSLGAKASRTSLRISFTERSPCFASYNSGPFCRSPESVASPDSRV